MNDIVLKISDNNECFIFLIIVQNIFTACEIYKILSKVGILASMNLVFTPHNSNLYKNKL